MQSKEIYAALAQAFPGAVEPSPEGLAGDPFVCVAPGRLHEIMAYLKNGPDLAMDQLTMISGVDRGEWIESVYHLYSQRRHHCATIKVKLDREAPEADSVCDLWGAADWHEREAYDMMGIRYRGHPNLRRILLPEDWEGHPLRQDYEQPQEYHGIQNDWLQERGATRAIASPTLRPAPETVPERTAMAAEPAKAPAELETEELLVNMGPQHPSTHGVLRLVIRTDGEYVRETWPHIGYLHRCFERIAQEVTYAQVVPYTDRLDYLSSMNNAQAYCMAVERLGGIEVPPRAEHLRVIFSELNRIGSHLLAFGTYGLDLGAFTPFIYGFRERELLLDIFEKVSGGRLLYHYPRIGGVARDITAEIAKDITDFLRIFPAKWDEYNTLLSFNKIFIERTANVGVIPAELAVRYGLTGPCLRGSGAPYDIRKVHPYSIYDQLDFKIALGEGLQGTLGDSWDRYWVRMVEMMESLKIVQQCLDGLPEGPIQTKISRVLRLPDGEAYTRVENPRGELGFYIVSDKKKTGAVRCRVRAPSFCNLSVTHEVAKDCLVADVLAIVGSIDIVLGEVDR